MPKLTKILPLCFFFILAICDNTFAEIYFFKNCKMSENVYANYLINLDKKEINAIFKSKDESVQKFTDKIQTIEKSLIVSHKIQSKKNKKYYEQYYLDAESKSVTRQIYKKGAMGILMPDGPKKINYCMDVKADWNKNKKDESSETLKLQKEIWKKEKTLPKCEGGDFSQWNNCKGKYVTEQGYNYIGHFINGKIFEGTALYPGKTKYVGEFKNNEPHGQGTFTYDDGSIYIGEWKDGKNYGNGIKIWKDGKKYTGVFKDDKIHGKGTFLYPDGSKYIGEFKNNKKHGSGTIKYADGSSYVGKFIDGIEHGEGKCFDQDGSAKECRKDISSSGRDTHNISFNIKKWIKVSEYKSNSGKGKIVIDKLNNAFRDEATSLCSSKGSYVVLDKKIEVFELDETPAYGLETVVKLGISGVVECK